MRIPAFGLGGTPTPYTFVEESTKGQRDATATAGRAQAIEAAALADAGQTMMNVGKDVYAFTKRIEEQEALTAVQAGRSVYRVKSAHAALDWENTIDGPTALNSLNGLKERLEPIKQEIIDSAPNELAKERLKLDLDAHEADVMVHGEKVARKKFTEHSVEVDKETHNNLRQAARLAGQQGDVAALQGVIDQRSAGLMAMGASGVVYSKSEADLLNSQNGRTYVADFLQGQLDNDRTAMKAIRDFEAGQYNEKLGAKEYDRMKHMVEVRKHHFIAEARRAQAEAMQKAREDATDTVEYLQDQVASATATGRVTGDTGGALLKLRKLGGKFARKADNLEAAITSGMTVHGTLQEGVFLPFDEQRKRLQALQPSDGEENYAIKAQAIQRGLHVLDTQEDAFRKNPAGFTMRRAATQVAQNGGDPAADFSRVLKLSLDIQRQMGLSETELRVIPAKEAKQIAGQFQAADADGRLQIISKLAAYGPYKDKALAELKIDPSALHAAAIMDTNDPQALNAARLLVDVSPDKVKLTPDEEKAATTDVLKNAAVPALLQKQAAFMARGGVSRNVYAQELTSVGARIARLTGNPRRAAEVLDMAYTTVDDDRLALALVPKDISQREAVRGFSMLRESISEDDLADMKAALVASKGAGTGERLFQQRFRDIKRSGVWINDGDGFALYDPGTQLPVAVKGGRPFRVTTAQLKDATRQLPSATDSVADEIPTF